MSRQAIHTRSQWDK